MKLKRFNEIYDSQPLIEKELELKILEILKDSISTRSYYGDTILDTDSLEDAAIYITQYLKERGLILALDAEKYNI